MIETERERERQMIETDREREMIETETDDREKTETVGREKTETVGREMIETEDRYQDRRQRYRHSHSNKERAARHNTTQQQHLTPVLPGFHGFTSTFTLLSIRNILPSLSLTFLTVTPNTLSYTPQAHMLLCTYPHFVYIQEPLSSVPCVRTRIHIYTFVSSVCVCGVREGPVMEVDAGDGSASALTRVQKLLADVGVAQHSVVQCAATLLRDTDLLPEWTAHLWRRLEEVPSPSLWVSQEDKECTCCRLCWQCFSFPMVPLWRSSLVVLPSCVLRESHAWVVVCVLCFFCRVPSLVLWCVLGALWLSCLHAVFCRSYCLLRYLFLLSWLSPHVRCLVFSRPLPLLVHASVRR